MHDCTAYEYMEYEYPLFLVKGRKEVRSKVNVNRGEYNELEVRSEVKCQSSKVKGQGQRSKVKGQMSKVKGQSSKVKMRHFSLKPIFATLDARNDCREAMSKVSMAISSLPSFSNH